MLNPLLEFYIMLECYPLNKNVLRVLLFMNV